MDLTLSPELEAFRDRARQCIRDTAPGLDDGRWAEGYLWARGFTISAGSNEVMRNQIAERGLGLPRE